MPENENQAEKRQEFIDCVTYFSKLWEERKENPGKDLVSMLVHGEATKDMEPMEHLGNLLLFIVGGNDTTRNSMSGSVYALNKFPDQYDKLIANPELIPKLVAEMIRWQTPLAYMRRTVTQDIEVGGKQIKAGDQVLMWYVSGNRLAEMQLRILWEEIVVRFEKIEVQEEPDYTFSSFVKGYTSLPVKVQRKVG